MPKRNREPWKDLLDEYARPFMDAYGVLFKRVAVLSAADKLALWDAAEQASEMNIGWISYRVATDYLRDALPTRDVLEQLIAAELVEPGERGEQ